MYQSWRRYRYGNLRTGAGFVVPAVVGGDPSSVTGLSLWLKADAGVYNDAGTTLATNGQTVQQWNDYSGNSRHATQATSAQRPTFQTGQINSLPALNFDAANSNHFDLPNFASGFTAGEIFIVVAINTDPPATDNKTGLWSFGDTVNFTHYPYTDGVVYEQFGTDTRKTVGNPAAALTSWRLYNVRSAASDFEAYFDGTSLFSTATNTVAFDTVLMLGANEDFANCVDGRIAEVVMYNKGLSGGERTTVKSYIATKYALTIA